MDSRESVNTAASMPWYKKWWVILIFVFALSTVISIMLPKPGGDLPGPPSQDSGAHQPK